MVKLSEIKLNPNNPRIIKDEKFKQLVQSLRTFPKMLNKRPIVIDDKGISLGGNMRYKGIEEIVKNPSDFDDPVWQKVRKTKSIPDEWVSKADDFTEDEKKRYRQ